MSENVLPPRSTGLYVFESVASIALVALAMIGNVFILLALHRNRRLQNCTNIYIVALAITDLLNASIPGTLFASTVVSGRLVFSLPACRVSGFLVHFLNYVSMSTMALTAVNRYIQCIQVVLDWEQSFFPLEILGRVQIPKSATSWSVNCVVTWAPRRSRSQPPSWKLRQPHSFAPLEFSIPSIRVRNMTQQKNAFCFVTCRNTSWSHQ